MRHIFGTRTKQKQQNFSIMTLQQANDRANEITANIEDKQKRIAFGDTAAFLLYKGMCEEAVLKALEVMEFWAAEAEQECAAEVEDKLYDAIQDIDEGDLETCYFGRNSDQAYRELLAKELGHEMMAKAHRCEIDPVRCALFITRENLKRAGVSI